MQLYSTNNPSLRVSLREAVFQGMPADNGLFMPAHIPTLPANFLSNIRQMAFPEHAFAIAKTLLGDSIPANDLRAIIEQAINFPAPLIRLAENTYALELFHGPTLAFKDFGARFMAATMSYFLRNDEAELTILVATSGDTGGAVAAGFHGVPGIRVIVLYPSGQVSLLQERQFTSLGDNITAVEVSGSFDDCQALVKRAFLDEDVRNAVRLSTANSINIARLIPQIFYYFEAWRQLPADAELPVFSVPSGNFGNLTAGLLAARMGLPVEKFLAATNINDVVPEYLERGIFAPRASQSTLSSAMDVGNPSNFARILDLHGSTWNIVQKKIAGYRFTDEQTAQAMRDTRREFGYVLDPHGAVALLALRKYLGDKPSRPGIFLETAHPAKFIENVEVILEEQIPVPASLEKLRHKPKYAVPMPADFPQFKSWLLERNVPRGT